MKIIGWMRYFGNSIFDNIILGFFGEEKIHFLSIFGFVAVFFFVFSLRKWVLNYADSLFQAGTTAALLPDQLRLVIRIWLKVIIVMLSILFTIDDDNDNAGFDDHVVHAVGAFTSNFGIGCVGV